MRLAGLDLQADIAKAEAHAAELQQQLTASEASISSQSAELQALQSQLEGVQQELSKTAALVTERDNKVAVGATGCTTMSCVVHDDSSAAELLCDYVTDGQIPC